MLFASFLLLAAAESCAVPPPAHAPDPAAASAYVEVGEAELGHDSAAIAFREALRLDPANARARRGLLLACSSRGARFDRARALMDGGEPGKAAALFEQVREEEGPSPSVSLLEGICLYETGEDARARELLLEAAAQPSLADSARFYLGLIALREGNEDLADRELSRVGEASGLREDARDLRAATRVGGRLSLTATADSGFDSNVTLAPSGVPGGGDGVGGLSGTAVARPFGQSGPFARASGLYRAQFQLHEYDLGAFGAGVGWQLGHWVRHLTAEYAYDYVALGASPYLSANRLSARARWTAGAIALRGGYSLRFEKFRTPTTAPFSGTLHLGEAWLVAGPLEIGYEAARDLTAQAETTFFEHGPQALLRLAPSERTRAVLGADVLFRAYDAVDPALSSREPRSDTFVDLSALVEYDLSDRWSGRLTLGGRQAFSNIGSLAYLRITGALGVAYSLGVW